MKRILSLTLAMLMSVALLAQKGSHKDRSAEDIAAKQSERMKTELSLTDTQYASVKAINQKYATRVAELGMDTAMEKQKFHTEMRAIQSQKQDELKGVLSPEQQAKWTAQRDHQKDSRHGGKNSDEERKDHRKAEMKKALALSDEQSLKLDAAHREFKEKAKSIRDDRSLNDEAKKEKVKTLKASHETTVKNILTDEQFRKWKELKKDGKDGKDHRKRLNKEQHFDK